MICTKQSNGAYFAICPEINGCFTQGDTYEEASKNLQELVAITIREDFTDENIQEALLAKDKIYSEFEVVV
jgi:predicted RNase H-like HicB family nuclease